MMSQDPPSDDSKLAYLKHFDKVAQKLVATGEAATIEEAIKLQARRARQAFEEKYSEEQRREIAAKGAAAVAQKYIDRGEASTLEEAYKLQGQVGRQAFEAKYSESERSALARKGVKAHAQKLVDSGQAATIEEALSLRGSRANQGKVDKYGYAELQRMNSEQGVKVALQRGHRSRFPGVRWQKKQDRKTGKPLDEGKADPAETRGFWRVGFSYKGKFVNVGSGYANEEEAARAHDAFCIQRNLTRRLHFPPETAKGDA